MTNNELKLIKTLAKTINQAQTRTCEISSYTEGKIAGMEYAVQQIIGALKLDAKEVWEIVESI